MKTNPPILATSCVAPELGVPFLSLSDFGLRKEMTIKSLLMWTQSHPDLKIVLCDGSGYDFSNDLEGYLPDANIECIIFKNSRELVRQLGKGYGEGEIIKYALKKSVFLQQANFFAKCTARLYVENFHLCLSHWNEKFICRAEIKYLPFLKSISLEMIDARFFVVDKGFFIENLADAYLSVNDLKNYYLEHAYRNAIIAAGIENFLLPTIPIIRGISGVLERTTTIYLMENDTLKKKSYCN